MSTPEPSRHNYRGVNVTASKLLCLIAVVLFVLAALGVHVASLSPVELVACGLAFLGASFIVP